MRTLLLLAVLLATVVASNTQATFTEKFFKQRVDHFRFTSSDKYYEQRYLWNDENWTGKGQLPNGCKGPILFYTGNEGPIDDFWSGNGFMIDVLAPKWGALVIFAEHRYYGKSLPFGAESFYPDNVPFFTTEQALADYAVLLTEIKAQHGAKNCPVIAFGGSYGGTLTTYFRMKYPAVVAGGLAASAPFRYYVEDLAANGLDEYTWIDIANRDYQTTEYPACFDTLVRGVEAVAAAGATAEGRANLTKQFRLCSDLEDVQALLDVVTDALETMPQMNYPYPVGGLPAWPVNATCKAVAGVRPSSPRAALVAAMAAVVALYTPGVDCVEQQGQGGIPGGGPWSDAWGYQSCTETLHAFSARGFRAFNFSKAWADKRCAALWAGVTPSPAWTQTHFGTTDVRTASNLIFSNGRLDPWHGGGVLSPDLVGDSCHVLIMDKGAHHLDLRGPNPADPPEVTHVRALEEQILWTWIQEASK